MPVKLKAKICIIYACHKLLTLFLYLSVETTLCADKPRAHGRDNRWNIVDVFFLRASAVLSIFVASAVVCDVNPDGEQLNLYM